MRITVCDRYQPTPGSKGWDRRTADAAGAELAVALTTAHPTDAHLTAYEPICPEGLNGAAIRLESSALSEGVHVRMVTLIGDVDDVEAHAAKRPASDAWRAAVLGPLTASGLAYYATRGGFRVLATLAEPVELTSPADARAWRALYLGWCAELRAQYGLALDESCADWTRLFRLPCVVREGVGAVTATVVGAPPAVDAYAIQMAPDTSTAAPSAAQAGAADRDLTPEELADLARAAEVLEPHFERGKRNALALALGGWLRAAGMPPSSAGVLVGALPSEAPVARVSDALRAWNTDGPVEGWAALRRLLPSDALSELERIRVGPSARKGILGRLAARHEANERRLPAKSADADTSADPADPYVLLGRRVDLTTEPAPLEYLVEGLPFAPGGKVNAIAGPPNAGKSPWAQWLMLAVATGGTFLGRRVLRSGGALYLDAETGRLAHIRWRRMCRAAGVDPATVADRVDFRDVEVTFTEAFCMALESYLQAPVTAVPIQLVVVDTYGAMLGGEIDHNSPEFSAWLRALGRLSRAVDVVIIVLIHEKKTMGGAVKGSPLEMIAGSFSAAGAMQAVLSMRQTGDGNTDPIAISCSRAPEDKFEPFAVVWTDVRDPKRPEGGRYAEAADRAADPERQARLWGLRCDVAIHDDQSATTEDPLTRGKASVLKYLARVGVPVPQTLIKKNTSGYRDSLLPQLLEELAEAGLVTLTDHRHVGKGGTEVVSTVYAATPRAARSFEARAKLT